MLTYGGDKTITRMMRLPNVLACLLLGASTWAAGDRSLAGAPPGAELAALESLLEQETQIVTRTRLNRDFVPGMVTVLDGETLQNMGARTVWDALPYVPGVQASLDARGAPSATVRGVAFPFNSGNIRILIDGVPVSRESAGQNFGAALFVPLDQVERIEFIRGPGSVVYGAYAFQGLLNIVTRRDTGQATAYADSRDGAGGSVAMSGGVDGWTVNLNAAASSADALLPSSASSSHEDRHSVFASVSAGGFSAKLGALGRKVGTITMPGGPPGVGATPDENNWSLEAGYEFALAADLSGTAALRYLHSDFETGPNNLFRGDEMAGRVELNWTGWKGQEWLLGAEYTSGDVDRAVFTTGETGGRPPQRPMTPSNILVFSGDDRDVVAVYAQGQIEFRPDLHLTLGARYDDVDFVGERITPRVSLVWQAADNHILKVQYAEGFRAPTYFERAGSPGYQFDFEVNKTAEMSYIYRRAGLVFRATAFDSRIDDMIFVNARRGSFENLSSARTKGLELELSYRMSSRLALEANVSAVDSEDNRNPAYETRSPGTIPDWMSNVGAVWNIGQRWTLGAHWNHLADRPSAQPFKGTLDQVDIALTATDLFVRGLDLRIGVVNVFNGDATYVVDGAERDFAFAYDTNAVWAQARWKW